MKNVNLKDVKDLVNKFINSNIDEYEFVIDNNNLDYWEINYDKKEINISECCSVYIREIEDKELESYFNDDEFIINKYVLNDLIIYILM